MEKKFTSFLLPIVLAVSACDRGLTSVESRHQASAAKSEMPSVPCGQVLRLDENAVKRLDLYTRLPQLVTNSAFTDEELQEVKSSNALLREEVLDSYRSAYSTWYRSTDDYQSQLDYAVTNTIHSKDYAKLPPKRRALNDAYLAKFEKMMLTAHNLGRDDAKRAPCPF